HDQAIADHGGNAGAQDSCRQQRKLVRFAIEFDGMTGVVASLVTDDNLMRIGQDVDDLALGFVSPLQADNRRNSHSALSVDEPIRGLTSPGSPGMDSGQALLSA